jgi:hypothetical protein
MIGKSSQNSLPLPMALRKPMRPPISSTMRLVGVSPIPVPSRSDFSWPSRWKGSSTWDCMSSGIPRPESATVMRKDSSLVSSAQRLTEPPRPGVTARSPQKLVRWRWRPEPGPQAFWGYHHLTMTRTTYGTPSATPRCNDKSTKNTTAARITAMAVKIFGSSGERLRIMAVWKTFEPN